MADAAVYSNDNNIMGAGSKFRRARMMVFQESSITIGVISLNVNSSTDYNKSIADAFFKYIGFEDMSFRVGNMKGPFSLQVQRNANYKLFMERSLTNDLILGGI
jgi:phosphate-selective porin